MEGKIGSNPGYATTSSHQETISATAKPCRQTYWDEIKNHEGVVPGKVIHDPEDNNHQ
jgi:hypothetical protein